MTYRYKHLECGALYHLANKGTGTGTVMPIRYILLFSVLLIALLGAPKISAETQTCEIKGERSVIARFLIGQATSFIRNGSSVADMDVRNSRLEFGKSQWRTIPQETTQRYQIQYEFIEDQFGVKNYVFFSFVDFLAAGTAVLTTRSDRSVMSLRHLGEDGVTQKHTLTYSEKQALEDMLSDASCLLDLVMSFE